MRGGTCLAAAARLRLLQPGAAATAHHGSLEHPAYVRIDSLGRCTRTPSELVLWFQAVGAAGATGVANAPTQGGPSFQTTQHIQGYSTGHRTEAAHIRNMPTGCHAAAEVSASPPCYGVSANTAPLSSCFAPASAPALLLSRKHVLQYIPAATAAVAGAAGINAPHHPPMCSTAGAHALQQLCGLAWQKGTTKAHTAAAHSWAS